MADSEPKQMENSDGSVDNSSRNCEANNKQNVSDNLPTPVLASARSAFGKFFSKSESIESNENSRGQIKKIRKHRDPRTIERNNLLNVSKLIIKELIDSSMAHGRMLDDDHEPLQQFFIVLEHVLRHGLRPKKSILRDRRDFWCVLELVEKFVPEAAEITATVRDMPRLKTPLGKARAWLRLAAMQKTLADYFKVLIEKRDLVLVDFYEPGALILEDEGTVIAGLLVGLNVIDCNLGIKDDDLDQPLGVIDFSVYLKDTRLMEEADTGLQSVEAQEKLQTILDQKNYLEELNRHLNATVANLQQKLEMSTTTNALMKEDLAISKNLILQLEDEKKVLETQRDTILNVHKQQIEMEDEQLGTNGEVALESRDCNSPIEIIEIDPDNNQSAVDGEASKEYPEKEHNEQQETSIKTKETETVNMAKGTDEKTEPAVEETDTSDPVRETTDEIIGELAEKTEAHETDSEGKELEKDASNEEIDSGKPIKNKNKPEPASPSATAAAADTLISSTSQIISNIFKSKRKESKKDIDVERQTYQQSRAGLDDMYADMKKRLEDEIHLRLDVEKEMELQISMKQEVEMALQLLEKDVHEKQDSIIGLRQQLEDVKTINLQMYNKLETCDSSLKHKTAMVTKLEEKTNQLVSALKDMEKRLKQTDSDKNAAEETARKLGQNLADKDAKRTALETDLRIEKDWRGNLQKNLEQEKLKVSQLQTELQKLKLVQEEYTQLQKQHLELKHLFNDQEKALAELGSHLSESKLRVEDMKEVQFANRESTWTSDKEATQCKQCEKPFSVARRKHHCRNCGDIFCADCSDNKMPHASSSKPVRVCDTCQELLLQRYSATGK